MIDLIEDIRTITPVKIVCPMYYSYEYNSSPPLNLKKHIKVEFKIIAFAILNYFFYDFILTLDWFLLKIII